MSTFPNSPRLQKGAIFSIGLTNPIPSIITFQYNPATVSRTLTLPGGAGGTGSMSTATRKKEPPRESIDIDITIDATDQLEQADAIATSFGIHPQLAALELLLYPSSVGIIVNQVLLSVGMIEIIPPKDALTLFVWGDKRVVPIRLTSFSIEETEFDPNLNPIRATVKLGMEVLTYNDLGLDSPGGILFMAHQISKEVMATLGMFS